MSYYLSQRMIGALIAFITIVLTLAALAMFESNSQVPELVPSEYDKKLLRLERRGTDAAYTNRIALLYTNWMTDTTESSQDRALKGHRKAREIYIKIMTGIDAKDPEGKEDGK